MKTLERLQALRPDMEKCFRCSLCKMVPLPVVRQPEFTDACPPARYYHFHGYSGSGKQIAALSLLHGRISPDPALAELAFACTACGYCDVACKFIMDAERWQVNMALREHLAENKLIPPALLAAAERGCDCPSGPPLRAASPAPRGWAEGLNLKQVPRQSAEVLVFAGCSVRHDDRAAANARKLVRLLRAAGVEPGTLGDDEPHCGLPLYWAGERQRFGDLAAANADALDRTGVKTIITVGSCLGAFRSKYPEYARALRTETLHASEYLARLVEQGRLRLTRPIKTKVTYHDPCYLGRQSEPFIPWRGEEKTTLGVMTYKDPPKQLNRGVNGVYDAPRRLLRAIPGLEFTELYRIREYAFCCGAGGLAPHAYPDLARSAALHRLAEARAVGAEQLVSACSRCEAHLRQAQPDGHEPMPIADLLDLVAEAAGVEADAG